MTLPIAWIAACATSSTGVDAQIDAEPDAQLDAGSIDAAPAQDSRADVAVPVDTLDATTPPDAGPWRSEPALPGPRQEIAAAVVGGRVFVVGGFENGQIVDSVRIFDPAGNGWSLGPPLPSARHHVALAEMSGDLYAMGGELTTSFRPDATCYVLRAGTTSWRSIAPLPEPRGAAIAGGIDGRIYVAGGMGMGATLPAAVAIYDPVMDRWTAGAPIPSPREHLSGFVHGGRLWAVGGRRITLSTNTAVVETYDPVMDRWSSAPSLITPRGGLGAAVLDGVAYAIGGEQPDRALEVVETLDLGAPAAWRNGPALGSPRHGHAVAAVAGRVYVIGGANRPIFAAVSLVESYAP